MKEIHVDAPAKVNPFLAVLGKRADGYHEIETFLVAIDLEDTIRARISDSGGVSLRLLGEQHSADIPSDARNLAVRAAAGVLERARRLGRATGATGLELELEKRIPSQAGLGGASTDAAAAWLAAATLFELAIGPAERDEALGTLGSDTVFFAAAEGSGAAWCTGRGEQVRPAPAPRGWTLVLVTPALVAPTAAVYAAVRSPLWKGPSVSTVRRVDWSSLPPHVARAHLGNALEEAALAAIPGLARWRELLDALELAHFRLSGSGSSFFGLYPGDADAGRDLDRIQAAARARGLSIRFAGLVHPSGRGARVRSIA